MKKRKINELTIFAFVILTILFAIPYMVSGYVTNFIDAIFESCSGLTTTGATVFYANLGELPKWLLFYRSFTNFVGGFIVLLFIFKDSWKNALMLYSALAMSLLIALSLAGMDLFNATCYALSTISTGGFTTSLDGLNNPVYQIIIVVFMIVSVFDYAILLRIRFKGIKEIVRDDEIKFFVSSVIIASCFIFILNCVYSGFNVNPEKMLLDSIFQVTSIITTTGYVTVNYMAWPTVSLMILFALFFINGCTNSPSGGVKSYRIIVCLKLIKRSFTLRIHPNRIVPLSYNKKELSTESAIGATSYIMTFIVTLVFSAVALSLSNLDFVTTFTSAFSLLSNVGASFPENGIMLVYENLPSVTKLLCPIIMFMGRFELTMVMMFFSKFYWNRNRG